MKYIQTYQIFESLFEIEKPDKEFLNQLMNDNKRNISKFLRKNIHNWHVDHPIKEQLILFLEYPNDVLICEFEVGYLFNKKYTLEDMFFLKEEGRWGTDFKKYIKDYVANEVLDLEESPLKYIADEIYSYYPSIEKISLTYVK